MFGHDESNMISIIMPSYNASDFISDSINSVILQTYKDWELIIVDDCSEDNTVDIVKGFVSCDSRIKLILQSENAGAAVARNTALEICSGRYVAFLDSDDLWFPNKLQDQIDFMISTSSCFVFSAYEKIDESGNKTGVVGVPEKVVYEDLLKTCVIGCLTVIYDTEVLGKVEMPLIRKRQDFGLWLNILKKTRYANGIQVPLAQYRVRKESISYNKIQVSKFTWMLYRDVEKISLFKSIYYFSHYAVRGYLRNRFPSLSKILGLMD